MATVANQMRRLRPEEAANEAEFKCGGVFSIGNNGEKYLPYSFFNWRGLISQKNDTPDDPYADADGDGPKTEALKVAREWWAAWQCSQNLMAANQELFKLTSNSITGDRSFGSGVGAVAYVKGDHELSEAHSALREAARDLTIPQISVASKDIALGAANPSLTLNSVGGGQFNFADAANAITYEAPANVVALRPAGSQHPPYKPAAGF